MSRMCIVMLAAFLVLAACSPAQAVLIVSWDFNDSDGNADANHIRTDLNPPVFSPGPGITTNTFLGMNATGDGFDALNAGAAVLAGDYYEFTVTADDGSDVIDLTSLTFSDVSLPLLGPTSLQLEINGTLFGAAVATNAAQNIDLTSLAPANSFTFRIVGFGAADAAQLWTIDNVTLDGVVSPEPSSLLLAGIAIPGLYLARRRKQRLNATTQPATV